MPRKYVPRFDVRPVTGFVRFPANMNPTMCVMSLIDIDETPLEFTISREGKNFVQ